MVPRSGYRRPVATTWRCKVLGHRWALYLEKATGGITESRWRCSRHGCHVHRARFLTAGDG